MNKTTIHGIYDDDDQLKDGAIKLRDAHINVKEVFSPFPVHGLDPLIGVPRTRLAVVAFLFGITGTCLSTLMMWYMSVQDWPSDIGGKPNWIYYFNLPAFIPVTFESTVFCAAHLMFLTFLFRSNLFPGVSPTNPDPRTTDDRFLMLLEVDEAKVKEATSILKQTGASEVNIK